MITEGRIGQNLDIQLEDPLDVWSSGAVGSSARVFRSKYRKDAGEYGRAAFKVMRPNQREYALPLFVEEFKILKTLSDVAGVVHALEYGFARIESEEKFPDDKTAEGARLLTGDAIRFSCDEKIDEKLIESKVGEGWLPYIILESKHYSNNLLMLCDPMKTKGEFMDVKEGIHISAEICRILDVAHQRNIAYLDHKIIHFYRTNGHDGFPHAYILDWNIAKWHKKLSDEHRKFDIVQFSARALHYIFAGRAAPGALNVGPTRPEDIQKSPSAYKVNWNYDDNDRLSDDLKQVIEAAVSGHYVNILDIKKDLMNLIGE